MVIGHGEERRQARPRSVAAQSLSQLRIAEVLEASNLPRLGKTEGLIERGNALVDPDGGVGEVGLDERMNDPCVRVPMPGPTFTSITVRSSPTYRP